MWGWSWWVFLPLGILAAFVIVGLSALSLADRCWYVLVRALQRRGWAIEADETPLTDL